MTFAEQLCSDLRNMRVDLSGPEKHRRPIIFMAHGVGGLVVKRALVDHKTFFILPTMSCSLTLHSHSFECVTLHIRTWWHCEMNALCEVHIA